MTDLPEEQGESRFEQAKRCPQCKNPGDIRKQQLAPRMSGLPFGTKILHIYCVSRPCDWYNTPWIVQVNADGTIPAPTDHKGEEKVYVGFEGHDAEAEALVLQLKMAEQLKTGTVDPNIKLDPEDPFGLLKTGKKEHKRRLL